MVVEHGPREVAMMDHGRSPHGTETSLVVTKH